MAGKARTLLIQNEGLGCWWGGAHGHEGQTSQTACELESDEEKIFHVSPGVNSEVQTWQRLRDAPQFRRSHAQK